MKPLECPMNEDGRINFGVYHINEECGWGYEVMDTIEKETLRRGHGFKTMEEARESGRKVAIKIIEDMKNE